MRVVGVGASAGGLEATRSLIGAAGRLPGGTELSWVVVVHLDPTHASALAEQLQASTSMPVVQVTELTRLETGRVYVIPPGQGLVVDGEWLRLEPLPDRAVRAPIDRFLESLAVANGPDAAAVILSGLGSDGANGARRVRRAGGLVLAQSPEDAPFDGMPRSAVLSGAVQVAGTVPELAQALCRWARGQRAAVEEGELLDRAFEILRRRTSHDFSGYRSTSFLRRLHHRMDAVAERELSAYVDRLEQDPEEAARLVDDVLVNVTSFFRDPECFEAVSATVLPELLDGRDPGTPVRVWVVGCATGEEVYSLAILLSERLSQMEHPPDYQVFGTDIDRPALEVARRGVYPRGIERDVTADRLGRFFTLAEDGWRISTAIRAKCVFTEHDVVRDPPFSKLDLVSCRNLLIYLGPSAKERVLEILHYALVPRGFLFLGPAESVPRDMPLFETADAPNRIFRKTAATAGRAAVYGLLGPPRERFDPRVGARPLAEHGRLVRQVERILLEDLAPPSVVVDERHRVLFFVGRTNPFLGPPAGTPPTDDLLELAQRPLRHGLRAALRAAAEGEHEPRYVARAEGDPPTFVELVVRPLRAPDTSASLFLVTFQPVPRGSQEQPAASPPIDDAAQLLESELRETRTRLEATIEEREQSNEELKDANDELLSINEELQSANEELQTSKEELQSMNEELRTLNQELAQKIDALDRANADIRNLFASTDVATLFLDLDLVINRFTPRTTRLFRLIEADRGRPIADIATRFDGFDLVSAAKRVLASLEPCEMQVFAPEGGRWYVARVHPYRTLDDIIDGVVITFVDVTDLKREIAERRGVERELALQRDRFVTALEGAAIIVFNQDRELRYTWTYNPQQIPFPASIARTDAEVLASSEEAEAIARLKRRVMEKGMPERAEVTTTIDGDCRTFELRLKPLREEAGAVVGLTGAAMDVTEARRAVDTILATAREFRAVFEAKAAGNAEIDLPSGRIVRCNARFAEFTGLSEQALGGALLVDRVTAEDRGALEQLLSDVAAQRQAEPTTEVRFVHEGGRVVWAQLAGAHVGQSPEGVDRGVLVAIDVTERHDLEESLLHARKVEAIGRLAGGVAHDFNNLITVASGHLELMLLENPDRHELEPHVEGIREALGRAAELTQRLLTFARREAVVPRAIRPGDLVRRTERVLRRIITPEIELVIESEGEPDPIRADPAQIEQMLVNLVVNARDAMPKGGRITIEAANETLDEHRLAGIPDVKPGAYVRFSITDTGTGMDADTLARCLDPFFTTKPIRKGTGLGLSSVYGTARQSGGFLEIESEVGRGTTARIHFPRTTEPAAAPIEPTPIVKATGGDETLLVVEDEPSLLELNVDGLSSYGYRVLSAENGARALEVAREHPGPIHLVITDVLMPVVDGRELAERLPSIRPGIPVLFVSGYTGPSALPVGAAFLAKPFTPTELAERVRAELDARRADPSTASPRA